MDAHQLYAATDEGKAGTGILDLTTRQASALRVVGDAVAWRMDEEMKERERKSKQGRGH